MKGNNYLLDFLRGSAQFRIITESLEVINTGARAHSICQLPRSVQYHRGRPAFFFSFRADGGGDGEGWGGELGSPSQPSFYRKSAAASAESWFSLRTLVDVAGTMCLTCLAGDVMERGADGSAQLPPAKFGSVREGGGKGREECTFIRARSCLLFFTNFSSLR